MVLGGVASAPNGFNSISESETEQPISMDPPLFPLGRFDPYFDAMTPRNVTALVGKSAYLSCKVRNLGNKTVSLFYLVFNNLELSTETYPNGGIHY